MNRFEIAGVISCVMHNRPVSNKQVREVLGLINTDHQARKLAILDTKMPHLEIVAWLEAKLKGSPRKHY